MILIVVLIVVILIVWWLIRSPEATYEEERYIKALSYFQKGEFKGVLLFKKKEYSESDLSQIVIQMTEAIQDNNVPQVKELSMSYPNILPRDTVLQVLELKTSRVILERKYDLACRLGQIIPSAKNHLMVGIAYLNLQQYENAKIFLEKALEYKKTFTALYNLMIAHTHLNYYKDALKDLKELRTMFPEQLSSKKKLLIEIPLEHLMEVQ